MNKAVKYAELEIAKLQADLQLCIDVHRNALKIAQQAFDRMSELQEKMRQIAEKGEGDGILGQKRRSEMDGHKDKRVGKGKRSTQKHP
jgi:hypothetical protein